jgi:hypothetical protein
MIDSLRPRARGLLKSNGREFFGRGKRSMAHASGLFETTVNVTKRATGQIFSPTVVDRSETYAYLSAAGEQSLSHLDVARHSDLRISLQRFAK